MNLVILKGRLVADPEVALSQSGTKITRFRIAVDRANKTDTATADFFNCVSFKTTADFVEKYFSKGNQILIQGRLQTGSYTNKDGAKVYTTDVVVDRVEFVDKKNSETSQNTVEKAPDLSNSNDSFLSIAEIDEDELPF